MKSSHQYESKLAIAVELAKLGARAVTITSAARTKPADSRDTYKNIRGSQSQSGQTPTDHQWFLFNQTRRQHGAFLLLAYFSYRTKHKEHADAHGLAFALAYRTYKRMTGEIPLVSPERFNLLVGHGFSIGWQGIIKGASSKFPFDNVKIVNCRKCRIPHLAEAHFLSYVCPAC